jgi:hypothetical protein
VLTLALTSGALAVLHGLDPSPARTIELTVLVAASVTATITRFVALRTWVFAREGSSVRVHDPRLLPSSRRAG